MDKNLQKYQAFVEVVEKGSFTKAARTLSYAQSSVSKMICDLEEECGAVLLERSRNGVVLTARGADLLPYAKRLAEAFREMEAHLADLNGLQKGLIRIGTFSSVATHWLPNVIREFQKTYPGIEYEMLMGDYGEIGSWIREGRVDCGFLRLPAEGLETAALKEDELLVVLPEGHKLAAGSFVDIRALEGEPFMMLEHGACSEVAELFQRHAVSPDVRFTTWDDYAIMSMVENRLGLSILPELILKRAPYRIAVRRLKIPAYRTIGVATRSGQEPAPAVKKFMEYLKYREAKDGERPAAGSADPRGRGI